MPLSKYDAIPIVMDVFIKEKPRVVLDVGIGMGAWGVLLRGLLDWADERYLKEVYQDSWTIIDGIEIFEGYHSPIWDYAYSKIMIGDVVDLIGDIKQSYYTIILMADVMEHLEENDKKYVISEACSKTGRYVIVVAPNRLTVNDSYRDINPHEKHLSIVELSDFPEGTKMRKAREQNIFIFRKF